MLKNYIFFLFFVCGSVYAQQSDMQLSDYEQKLVENDKLANAISLYPNPVDQFLKIESKGLNITRIEIVSILGGKEKELNSNFKSIFLGDLSRGIYLIKIYSDKGYTVKKLIKK